MSLPVPVLRADLYRIGEDLIDDFLELSSRLLPQERLELLDGLRARGIAADQIKAHPCFSIDERIIIISDAVPQKEFWIIDIKRRKISRHTFK